MNTVKDLRKQQYDYHRKKFPYLFDFIRNPYSFIKARFYMETSAVLVWFLLKAKIKPNTVTIIYGLAGIATGILLSIPNNYTIFIALVIAFSKGTLDWSDGHLARVTRQTSFTGHILDVFGAYLNSLGFQIGLGLYVAGRADTILFYYLVPILLFFRAGGLISFSKAILFDEISSENYVSSFLHNYSQGENQDNVNVNISGSSYRKYVKLFKSFLDDRARSVDLICLIILLEMLYNFNISWIVFLLILMKYFIIFIGSFYMVAKSEWAENKVMNKIKEFHVLFYKENNGT